MYGRIDVNPLQRLGDEFNLGVEKVFLCSGKDGYIPKYDPENGEYGCVENSRKLEQVFRILVCTAITASLRKLVHAIYGDFFQL